MVLKTKVGTEDQDQLEGTPVAVAVVARIRCAEHGRGPGAALAQCGQVGQRYEPLAARDWLPHEELLCMSAALGVEEGAAVAAVEGPPGADVRGGEGEGRGGGGDEAGCVFGVGLVAPLVEDTENRGCPMELMEAAAEAGVGDGAAPGLADDGGAEDAGWVVGREAKENLFDELVRERRRRCFHGWR
jgi:hypothetical protein